MILQNLSPLITKIVNASLVSGSVPSFFKSAIITPILKKSGADPFNFDNFRPISNLPFISKIIEKCIAFKFKNISLIIICMKNFNLVFVLTIALRLLLSE